MDTIPRSIALIILVLIGGIFSAAETAYSYCKDTRMKALASDGNRRAARVCKILDKYDKTIVTLLIVINIIHVSAAAISAVLFEELFPAAGAVISTVVLTLLMFIFSETIPKNIAKANSDGIAMGLSWLILALSFILTPLCAVFTFLGNIAKKIFKSSDDTPSMTEDEFSDVITDAVENIGVLDDEEGEIIKSAIEFSDLTANDVMTKRDEIVAIDRGLPLDEIKARLIEAKNSRIPLYEGSIDNITGILQSYNYLESLIGGGAGDMKKYVLPPYTVPPDIHLNILCEEMARKRMHLAVIVQNGKTLGVVTMDDILSEIVGEFDEQ